MHSFPAHWSITPASPTPLSSGWSNTEPMLLDALLDVRPRPFREVLRGLQVRELTGDEVFERYFSQDEE